MELSPKRKFRLSAASSLLAVSFMVYMLSDAGPVRPPYRDETLTAGPEPLMLVMQRSVREELKLTQSQVKQIQAALEKQSGRTSNTIWGGEKSLSVKRWGARTGLVAILPEECGFALPFGGSVTSLLSLALVAFSLEAASLPGEGMWPPGPPPDRKDAPPPNWEGGPPPGAPNP